MCDCDEEKFEYEFNTSEITTIQFSEGITEIGKKCFSNFENLQNVEFAESIESIKQNAFENTGITQLSFSNNIKEIEERVFQGCHNLFIISFNSESNIKSIGKKAFSNCKALSFISFPKQLEKFDSEMFEGSDNINIISIDLSNKYFIVDENYVLFSKDKKKLIYSRILHLSKWRNSTIRHFSPSGKIKIIKILN